MGRFCKTRHPSADLAADVRGRKPGKEFKQLTGMWTPSAADLRSPAPFRGKRFFQRRQPRIARAPAKVRTRQR